MKALLFDVTSQDFKVVDAEGIHDYYKLLNCDCIDICNRGIGGQRFEIVVDDEGLLKDNPILSAISPKDNQCCLVGNLLFYGGVDNKGDFTPITDEGVKIIQSNTLLAKFKNGDVRRVIEIDW